MIEESRVPTIGNRAAASSNDGMDGTTAGQINALTAKSTVVDADVTLIEDSAAGYAKKKSTFGTIKEWIMDWVATFIVAGAGISTSYNDAGDTLTINATGISATDEVIQDSIGGILGASLIYDDATPRIERAALTGAITAAQNSNTTSLGSFTKAQLDTAVSDGNVLYVGDLTQYTDEMAQDAIGLMIDSTLVYVDATPLLQRAAITGHVTIAAGSNSALLGSFTKAQLDAAVSDGNVLYVGDVTQYTDEMAQDAVGAMVNSSLVYTDATPLLERAALTGAITASQGSNTTSLGSFTKAQLDAAVSDGDVSYVGSNVTSLDTVQGVTTLGAIINGLTAKTTPADADMTVLMDSAASNASKKLSWANLKVAIASYMASVTQTMTNKRIDPRVQSVTSSTTVTPNADSDDAVVITAQAAGLTLANPSGTPVQAQPMIIRIKDNGTARSITWGTQYRGIGAALPSTTTISKTLYISMIYNSTDTKWDVVFNQEP